MTNSTKWRALASLALIIVAQGARPLSLSQDKLYQLAVEVDLVNVTATVLDHSGKYLEGLNAADFQIFEDGHEQRVSFFSQDSRAPVSIGVLIDISGSHQNRLNRSLETVREISRNLSGDDEMFIIAFNSTARMRQKLTSDPDEIHRSLNGLKTGGETAVYDAIAMGLKEIQAGKNQKKILLMITDCFDTRSKTTAAETEELLRKFEVLAYAIGMDEDPNVRKGPRHATYYYMLNKLTAAAGGRVIRLDTAGSPSVRTMAGLLLEELHQQYTLGYYTTPGRGGPGWRNIELRVSRPGAQARYRNGYYVRTGAD